VVRYYVLAKGVRPLPLSNFHWPYEVSLCFEGVTHPVAFSEGVGHGAAGGVFAAGEALSPSWAQHISYAGAEWLIPFIERLESNSPVTDGEVIQIYLSKHNGPPESFFRPST
jgi:hypothetical protein